MEGTFLWLSFWNGRRGKRNIFGLKQPPKTGLINRLHDSETKPDITFLSGSTTLPGFNLLWMQPDWLEQRGILYLRMTTWKITSSTCSLFGGTLLRKQNICSTSIFLGQMQLGNVCYITIHSAQPIPFPVISKKESQNYYFLSNNFLANSGAFNPISTTSFYHIKTSLIPKSAQWNESQISKDHEQKTLDSSRAQNTPDCYYYCYFLVWSGD